MSGSGRAVDRAVAAAYRPERVLTRAHVAVRLVAAPFDRVEQLVPVSGRVLDVGCGHGALALRLALGSEGRQIDGVDVDGAKVAVGSRAAVRAGVSGRVHLVAIDPDWSPEGGAYDGVVVCDVAYLLDDAEATRLGSKLVDALAPGGRLVVKELATRPRWKHVVATAQEHVAVRGLGITQGDHVNPGALPALRRAVEARGLRTELHRLDRGYPHPHVALVAAAG